MNNLSNERLEQIAMYGAQYNTQEARQMARELLALREAGKEPYVFTTEPEMLHVRHGSNGYIMNVSRIGDFSDAIPLYAASQLPAVPDGWVMVPIEPTEDMCFAPDVRVGNLTWDGHQSLADMHECREIYSAMIAAAPKPE